MNAHDDLRFDGHASRAFRWLTLTIADLTDPRNWHVLTLGTSGDDADDCSPDAVIDSPPT